MKAPRLQFEVSPRERRIRQRAARRIQNRHGCRNWTGASDEALDEWFAYLRTRTVTKAGV